MKRRSFFKLAAGSSLTLVGEARGDTSRAEVVSLADGASWHRFVAGGDVDFQVVRFHASRCTLRVIDQPELSTARRLGTVMEESGALAGINAGFFTPEFAPLGLVISDGRRAGQWQSSTLLGGAVMVKDGNLLLLWKNEVGSSKGVSQLVQAGPRLVNHGVAVGGLEANKQRSRSFIATDGDGGWLVGVASYTSLAELAGLLAQEELISGFKVFRALNFDGGKSTGLWLRKLDGSVFYEREFATVRNFVGIFPRN